MEKGAGARYMTTTPRVKKGATVAPLDLVVQNLERLRAAPLAGDTEEEQQPAVSGAQVGQARGEHRRI